MDPSLLDDQRFLKWLFLNLGSPQSDLARVDVLDEMLRTTLQLKALNIVLTNGFAADAAQALRNIGLAQHFTAVCDTRGSIVRNPSSPGSQPEKVNISGSGGRGRYSKSTFVSGCVFSAEQAITWFGVSAVKHLVYVDDDPEPLDTARTTTIRLPKEGSGLDRGSAAAVVEATGDAVQHAGPVIVAFDFDCTLSARHMFKAMHQPTSSWGHAWDRYAASEGSIQGRLAGGSDDHISEKPF